MIPGLMQSVGIIFLAFGGLLIAAYIWHKKRAAEVLVCPVGSNCNNVVHSSYAHFFGLPVELLGMLYYGGICLAYGVILLLPTLAVPGFRFFLLLAAGLSFLFSLYLTFIQGVALREWCTWCLVSAAVSTLIFSLSLTAVDYDIVALLEMGRDAALFVHLIAFALGVGGATFTDIFFFRFLRDFHVSEEESAVLKVISQVIWFALALLLLSGAALYLPQAEVLNQSPKFLVKMMVVLVLIINGAFLNLLVAPRLVQISFHGRHAHRPGELHVLRRAAFALGAVSLLSWYSAAFLGFLDHSPLPTSDLLAVYLILLMVGVLGSQVAERLFHRRARRELP